MQVQEFLGPLAFGLLVVGQFTAVIAVSLAKNSLNRDAAEHCSREAEDDLPILTNALVEAQA